MASTQPSSGPSTTTIVLATVGTLATAGLAYAAYFDYRRRSDPDFRRKLKKAQKQISKAEKQEAVQAEKGQKQKIRQVVDEANEEGFPRDPEKNEEYFMLQVAQGEQMCQDGESDEDDHGIPWSNRGVGLQSADLMIIQDLTPSMLRFAFTEPSRSTLNPGN